MNKLLTLDPNKCIRCALCTRVCTMQLEVHNEVRTKNFQLKNPDCIKCKICVSNCPNNTLEFKELQKDIEFNRVINSGIITSIKDLSNNVREIEISPDKNLRIDSGQFINLLMDKEKNIFRSYSISKISNKTFSITVKKINDGLLSGEIFKLNLNDKIFFEGPIGNELTIKNKNRNICLIGVGIGITPFVSILKDAIKTNKKVMLFQGAKFIDELYYMDEFESHEEAKKNFKYFPVVSREEFKNKGRVLDHLEKFNLDDSYDYYVCGKKEIISDLIKLKNLTPGKNLFYEVF